MIDARGGQPATVWAGRLASVLQASAQLPADECCATVFDQISAYQGEADQYDDMTMLGRRSQAVNGNQLGRFCLGHKGILMAVALATWLFFRRVARRGRCDGELNH